MHIAILACKDHGDIGIKPINCKVFEGCKCNINIDMYCIQRNKPPNPILLKRYHYNSFLGSLYFFTFIYFQLKDNCFTLLHWFLPNISVNQP